MPKFNIFKDFDLIYSRFIPADAAGGTIFLWMLVLLLTGMGCEGKNTGSTDVYIIRFDGGGVTLPDFDRAFDEMIATYPEESGKDPLEIKKMKLRFVNQLVEELVVTRLAETSGITVSDEELDHAVAEIKKDYPENTFEQTLLENAISFESWKKKVRTRLLMKKTTSEVITRNIQLTPDEIKAAYEAYTAESKEKQKKMDTEPDDLNRVIVDRLRREKTQIAYVGWIERLKEKYKVEIDEKQLEMLIDG